MFSPTSYKAKLLLMILLSIASEVSGQVDACQSDCSDYNSILVGCQSDSGQESVYDSCVCNDPNFQSYVEECIACEGTNSASYQFQQNCKNVAPDCTVACQGYGLIVSSCGDTNAAGFGECICSSAYDTTYTTTFNEDFQSCVACENGGGQASDWEAFCCANGYGCTGMSPAASSEAATIQPTTTTTSPTASSTLPVPTTTSSGGVSRDRVVNAFGIGMGQLALNALLGTL